VNRFKFSPLIHIFVFPVTITPSQASKKKVDLLTKELRVTYDRKMTTEDLLTSLYGDNKVPEIGDIHFDVIQNWVGNKKEKIGAAKNHLEVQLDKFIPGVIQNFSFRDVHGRTNLWDFPLKTAKVRGTTDIVVAAADSVDDAKGLAPEILLCIKMKDPPDGDKPVKWNEHIRLIKIALHAARTVSKRPLVFFLTDLTNGVLSLRLVARSNESFEIVQTEMTLDQIALIAAAILKPEYNTDGFKINEDVVGVTPDPEQDAVFFKRKYDQMYAQDKGGDVLKDLLDDKDLPLRTSTRRWTRTCIVADTTRTFWTHRKSLAILKEAVGLDGISCSPAVCCISTDDKSGNSAAV